MVMLAVPRFRPDVELCESRALLSAAHPKVSAAALAAEHAEAQAANTPPVILDTMEITANRKVVAFQINITKSLNPGSLANLSHYALLDQSPHNAFGGQAIPLASAVYTPDVDMLTLTPAAPLPPADYLLTSGNPSDPSTDFITDIQGRPLFTASKEFKVYFAPNGGAALKNVVLTSSPIVNAETGANFLVSARSNVRSAEQFIHQQNELNNAWLIARGGVGAGGVAVGLLRSL